MFNNICKITLTLQLLSSINTINAMNSSSIGINNPNVEMKDLSKVIVVQSNNVAQAVQNNTNISLNNELSELKQREILMTLYNYSIDKWKNIYHKYSFENDNIAYNKQYSCNKCITDINDLSQKE